MKHPFFERLGDDYPHHLEARYDRILIKLEELWDKPEIHDYFSDLLIDKRGNRQGFPKEVLKEIVFLREFRELETFRDAERKEDAIRELDRRGLHLKKENFLRALHAGDQEIVDLFVRANFNFDVPDENGEPPLLVALKRGYTIVAKILLSGGADVHTRDGLGLTPLLVACGKSTRGYKEIAEMLIKKGALVNVRDALGYTPLLLSLSGGTVEIARLLIEKGADITVRTRKGESVLSLAEKAEGADSAGIVDLLVSKGAKY